MKVMKLIYFAGPVMRPLYKKYQGAMYGTWALIPKAKTTKSVGSTLPVTGPDEFPELDILVRLPYFIELFLGTGSREASAFAAGLRSHILHFFCRCRNAH
jgi:hypothetical protein